VKNYDNIKEKQCSVHENIISKITMTNSRKYITNASRHMMTGI
jgi:hypothetical protein